MKKRRLIIGIVLAALVGGVLPGAFAEEEEGGLLDSVIAEQCQEAPENMPEDVPDDTDATEPGCETTLAGIAALQRIGVSAKEATEAEPGEPVEVEIADFYFNARVTIVQDGTDVVFRNGNAPGGNTHSVMSSDWGGTEPVLPVPGVDFGGGKGFRSSKLSPGREFLLHVDTATMNPASYVRLSNEEGGDVLIPFHCYIHGPNVMNGWILVHNEDEG
jgi:hypothetical protein